MSRQIVNGSLVDVGVTAAGSNSWQPITEDDNPDIYHQDEASA